MSGEVVQDEALRGAGRTAVQHPPAEVRYAQEPAELRAGDKDPLARLPGPPHT